MVKDYYYSGHKYILLHDGIVVIPISWTDMSSPYNQPDQTGERAKQEIYFRYRVADTLFKGKTHAWVYHTDVIARGHSVWKLKRIHRRRRRKKGKQNEY